MITGMKTGGPIFRNIAKPVEIISNGQDESSSGPLSRTVGNCFC